MKKNKFNKIRNSLNEIQEKLKDIKAFYNRTLRPVQPYFIFKGGINPDPTMEDLMNRPPPPAEATEAKEDNFGQVLLTNKN